MDSVLSQLENYKASFFFRCVSESNRQGMSERNVLQLIELNANVSASYSSRDKLQRFVSTSAKKIQLDP